VVAWGAAIAVAAGELGVAAGELGVDVAGVGLAAGAHASTAVISIAPSTTSCSCLKGPSPYDVDSDDRGTSEY